MLKASLGRLRSFGMDVPFEMEGAYSNKTSVLIYDIRKYIDQGITTSLSIWF